MARLSLNCSCGWNFFIPGSTPGHEVNCPSCAQTVRIPGRKPGKDLPMSAGEIAGQKQNQQRIIRMMVGIGVLVVIVAGIVLAFSMGSSAPQESAAGPETKDKGLTGLTTGTGTRTKTRAPAAPETIEDKPVRPASGDIYTSAQIQELRRGVYAHVWLVNMTTIVSECMRYRNLTNEWAQFQADIATYDSKIKYNLGELAKVGEKVALETYLAQGDQILGFAQRDFTTMKAGEAALILNTWLNNWRPGATIEQVNIARGDKKMTLYVDFPEDTKELLNLVRHPSLQFEGSPGSGNVTAIVAVPAELLNNINGGFDALPPGYRTYLIPADSKRLVELTQNKKGSSDDVDWLKTHVLGEAIPSFQREAETIRSKVLELEPKLKENVASDVIFRKNGTKVEGQIIQQTPEFVKIKSRFGAVQIPREEIEKIELGKGAATEFPAKYADAKGKLEKLAPLLAWCAEKNLKLEKEYVAYVILTLDASNEKARTAVGLARPAITGGGASTTPPKYPATQGSVVVESTERTIELIANDVLSRTQIFTDIVNEMRRRTETFTTSVPPFAPEKCAKGVAIIGNPLLFKSNALNTATATEIGGWWSKLTAEDRRQFAKYFGLWCAFTRGQEKK
jgi:hypothetical protein